MTFLTEVFGSFFIAAFKHSLIEGFVQDLYLEIKPLLHVNALRSDAAGLSVSKLLFHHEPF